MRAKIIDKRIMFEDRRELFTGDHEIETLTIATDRFYNGYDLNGFLAFLHIENSAKQTSKEPLTKSVSGNQITLTIDLTRSITAVAGRLEIQVVFEQGTSVIYHTAKTALYVEAAIDADEPCAQQNATLMQVWLEQMEQLNDDATSAVSSASASAQSAASSLISLQNGLNNYYTKAESDALLTSAISGAIAASY